MATKNQTREELKKSHREIERNTDKKTKSQRKQKMSFTKTINRK